MLRIIFPCILFISIFFSLKANINEDLLNSVLLGKRETVMLLLENGANPNIRSAKEGLTPILIASKNGDILMLKSLLDRGGNLKDKDWKYGSGSLHFAASSGNVELLSFLLQKGLSPEEKNANGNLPLHIAILNKQYQAAAYLSNVTKNIGRQDMNGLSALHLASMQADPGTVKILIEKKINSNAVDREGNTALHYAAMKDNLEMVRLLRRSGVLLDSKNKKGNTALHYAVMKKSQKLMGYLLRMGANPRISNEENETAVSLADKLKISSIFMILPYIKKAEPCREQIEALYDMDSSEYELSKDSRARIFEGIYKKYSSHSLFKYCLNAYIANGVGKSFWIGLYLFDREVSSVKDFGLAKEVLENCLKANKESSTLVSVRFILGVLFWRQNLKKEARAHFETAYKLSEKFPGSIPALSDAEKNAIENDLQILYHKEEGYITPGMLVIPDY